jgi:hypothetical protein
MSEQWISLNLAIESNIHPLLSQFGYMSKGVEQTERGGFAIEYITQNEMRLPIVFHALKQPILRNGSEVDYEIWLRVYLGRNFLKTMLGMTSGSNPDLYAGWLYSTDAEMSYCIQEIADGLKQVLEASSRTS